jgi:hypothetical protein
MNRRTTNVQRAYSEREELFTRACAKAKAWKQRYPGETNSEKICLALDELELMIAQVRSHPEFSRSR